MVKRGDNTETYEEYMEMLEETLKKEKKNYAPFYGGIVLMVAGAAILATTEGWLAKLTGLFILLFGICLVCVGWSTENEKR